MMSTIEKFKNYLINIKYPKQFEGWHIQGILKQNSNEVYKFDVSNLVRETDEHHYKSCSLASKADKMVFETDTNWILLDVNEVNNYALEHKLSNLNFEKLLEKLEWNIIVKK